VSLLDQVWLVFTVLTNSLYTVPAFSTLKMEEACSAEMLVSTCVLNTIYVFAGYERQDEHLKGQRA
jgi:nitric oxide reductase large subunit